MTRTLRTPAHELLRRRLTEARKEAGLSQEKLAKRLRRHQTFVSKYETGERRLDVIEFLEVAEALRLDALTLVEEVRKVSRRSRRR